MEITESLDIRTNAKNQDKGNSSNREERLIERKQIDGTPFTAIKDENGWYLVMGKYRLTEYKGEYEGLVQLVEQKNWDFMVTVIAVITEQITELKK